MAKSADKSHGGTQEHDDIKRKKKVAESAPEKLKAYNGEPNVLAGVAGNLMLAASMDENAALLGDDRFSHPANSSQLAGLVTQLQQSYGNAYVQQVMTRIQSEKGHGQPLESGTQAEMEGAFEQDFSDVHIHTGNEADRLSHELGAEAFTTGKDVFFKGDAYQPTSEAGKKLLGHELAHVVQQSEMSSALPTGVTEPSEAPEMEADRVGREVIQGEDFSITEQPREVLARQAAGDAPAPAAVDEAKPAPAPPTGEAEKTYKISLWGKEYTNLTKTQALSVLRDVYHTIHNWTEAEREGHQYLKTIRDDQWIVGWFADRIGGVEMPPLWMWNEPLIFLDAALSTLNGGLVESTESNLIKAEGAYRECHAKYYEYRGGTIKGAERAVTGLKVVAAAGAVAAGVATGGAATAALGTAATTAGGILTTSAVAGVTAGGYGAIQETATQTGEMMAGTREMGKFDWEAVLARGTKDAVSGLVGGIVGGSLAKVFTQCMGPYISKAVTDAELAELGIARDEFLTWGQKLMAEFLGDVGSTPVTTAVTVVVDKVALGGPTPKNAEEFASNVAEEAAKAGVAKLAVEFLKKYIPVTK